MMKLLKQITHGEPFESDEKKYHSSRVVLLDEDNKVALMYVAKVKFYTLPGGQINENETAEQAAVREIKEETGCDCEIIMHLGLIEESSKVCSWNGTSSCYIARVTGEKDTPNLEQYEIEDGYQLQWQDLHEALKNITNQEIKARDEREAGIGIIIQKRDIAMLDEAIKIIYV